MSPHKQKKKYCVINIFSFSREPAKPMRNRKQTGLCKFPFLGGRGYTICIMGNWKLVNASSVPVD